MRLRINMIWHKDKSRSSFAQRSKIPPAENLQ